MSSLKNSILWVAIYLTTVVVLAQFDYSDSPIIDFAKYFYFTAILVLPVTIFFPSISKVNVMVPMVICGCAYLVMLQMLDRTASSPHSTFAIILLEFILIETGVWLGYQLAYGISHAESLMDAMALTAFPNRIKDFDSARDRIRIEVARSRRYHRPFSLIVVRASVDDIMDIQDLFGAIQHDLRDKFSAARLGHIIDKDIRQMDLILRDHQGQYLILAPEVGQEGANLLVQRISHLVEEKAKLHLSWGIATFPDDALSFDDLLDAAHTRLLHPSDSLKTQPIPSALSEEHRGIV